MSRKIYFIISFGFASLYLFKYTYLHNMGTKIISDVSRETYLDMT